MIEIVFLRFTEKFHFFSHIMLHGFSLEKYHFEQYASLIPAASALILAFLEFHHHLHEFSPRQINNITETMIRFCSSFKPFACKAIINQRLDKSANLKSGNYSVKSFIKQPVLKLP